MKYYEDLEVGTKASFGHYEVTREEVIEFASKYDPQPFHLDDEAAAQTYFGRLSASGWHTCAMTMRMMVEHFSSQEAASLGSPGIDELRWIKPVYAGDTLRVEAEVTAAKPSQSKPDRGFVDVQYNILNQNDVLVSSYHSTHMLKRRDA